MSNTDIILAIRRALESYPGDDEAARRFRQGVAVVANEIADTAYTTPRGVRKFLRACGLPTDGGPV